MGRSIIGKSRSLLRRQLLLAARTVLAIAPKAVIKSALKSAYAPYASPYANLEKPPLFEAVYFELRTRCNGTCAFCSAAATTDTRPDVTMSRELFSKLIDELSALNYAKRVAFHVNNDPLIVPNLVAYVEEARRKLPKAWLQILTNGKALKNELGESLIDAGINEMSINCYAEDLNSPLPANVLAFQKEVVERRFKPSQLRSGHGPFPDSGSFAFNIFRRDRNEVLNSRGGTSPNKKAVTSPGLLGFCVYPFTQMNVTADGRVSKCCSDVNFEDVMGDANTQSLIGIWNGEAFRHVRESLLNHDRNALRHCASCDFVGVRVSQRKRRWVEEIGFPAAIDTD